MATLTGSEPISASNLRAVVSVLNSKYDALSRRVAALESGGGGALLKVR